MNIFIASLIGALTARQFGDSNVSILIATVITSVLIILFSEITPKSIASVTSVEWSLNVGRPLLLLMRSSKWAIWIFIILPKVIRKSIKPQSTHGQTMVTLNDLLFMVTLCKDSEVLEPAQSNFISTFLQLHEKELRDIMIPRTEIVTVESSTTLKDLMKIYNDTPYTRFPIWRNNQDNIVGTVSIRDLVKAVGADGANLNKPVYSLIQQSLFVRETKPLYELFKEMNEQNQKIAFAVDEFGSVSGLLTLTNFIEHIVGRTGEEGQNPPRRYSKVSENYYIVDGSLTIEQANSELNLGIPEGDYETVAGFFINAVQYIPEEQEQASVGDIQMAVIRMNQSKIEKLSIKKTASVSPDQNIN